MLSHENAQFREQLGYQPHSDGGGPADFVNSNGKRPMLGSDRYRPATSSSHSNHTPQGPDRLTLPPGQQPPSLSSNRPRAVPSHERPGSSRFKDKYAYAAPPAQHHTQPLSYAQAAPRRAKQNIDSQSAPQVQPRFKPAQSAAPSDNNARSKPPLTQMQNQPFAPKARNMGPPPTPQITNRGQVPMSARRGNANNRSLPPAQRFAPPMADQQRFAPATASGAPQRFSLDGTSTSHGHGGSMRGAQRAPFVPGGFG
ncbi:RING-type domain-containing protein [Mycena indigotica]|uniref:RING-type domain-containing protein n=1 Tax=Mycena indigotica TaxID=2126181 RepID=A0A8H6S8K4_9AGAR|nr:RING-type domain-containing protein [Mycena indigotica]KAF7294829.1 RING-type domain-containing protein [Mycena indigotica]